MQFMMGHRHRTAIVSPVSRITMACLAWKIGLAVSLALVMAVGFAIPVQAARQTIQKVDIASLPDAVQVTVSATMPLTLESGRIGDRFIVFDVSGHLAPGQTKKLMINSGGIQSVNCAWYKSTPPVARIAVATSGHREYSVSYANNKRKAVMKIRKAGVAVQATPKPVADGPVSSVSLPATTAPAVPKSAPRLEKPSARPADVEPPTVVSSRPVLVASAQPVAIQSTQVLAAPPKATPARRISLDFVASDIHDVLKGLSLQSGVNIIAGPDVKGDVTVSLNDVTVEEALTLVTNLSGYKYLNVDGTYVVGTADSLKPFGAGTTTDQKVTDVVAIKYADPSVVQKVIEKECGTVQLSKAPGSDGKEGAAQGATLLVLSGSSSDVQVAKAMAEAIESSVASTAASEVTEIYEVKYADIAELAALLSTAVPGVKVGIGPKQGFDMKCPSAVIISTDGAGGGSYGGSQGGSSAQPAKAPSKMLLLQGSREDVDKAKQVVGQLDVPQKQIVIEAKMVDLTESGAKDLGIEWGGEFGTLTTFNLTESRDAGQDALDIGRFGRSALSFSGRLKAVVESGKGKVLANPNVMALDSKPASIFIGDEVKYVTRVDENDNGLTVTTETARVGVQLHSVSTISSDGYITMNLHPEVSVIVDWKELPDVQLALPQISRRFVDSTIRVKDGETIVIGGLIKDEELKTMKGIPLLKDLPIIGSLFRYESKATEHSEVMMFITPKIVSSNQ